MSSLHCVAIMCDLVLGVGVGVGVSVLPNSLQPPILLLATQSRGSGCKASPLGQNLSVTSFCLIPSSLLFPPHQHMLSPQKAPERLLQLADSNLESLIVEMDQLHSRVRKSLVSAVFFFSVFLLSCHTEKVLARSRCLERGRIKAYWQRDTPLTFKLTPDRSKRAKIEPVGSWQRFNTLCVNKLFLKMRSKHDTKHISRILQNPCKNGKTPMSLGFGTDLDGREAHRITISLWFIH